MGNRNSSMLQDEEIQLISEETGFSPPQIERLYIRFKSLDKSGICGSLSRQDFLRVPELAINPLCDRIVQMFFVDCDDDHERINFRQFMKVLATFRSSTRPIRSRNASRQESIQTILNSLSLNRYRHSRHSSCDGFFNYYPVQHHMTNQHSIHYVASTTHLASSSNFSSHYANNNAANHNYYYPTTNTATTTSSSTHQAQQGCLNSTQGLTSQLNVSGSQPAGNNSNFQFKVPKAVSSLLDLDEPANSRKQKLYFMFKIYDVDNDDRLSLNDLRQILKMMVGSYISEPKLTDMAIKTLLQADKNSNGYIEFDEFCTAFLHRDIDETLRVKFNTQSTRQPANNKCK